jgi:hypothetical protein
MVGGSHVTSYSLKTPDNDYLGVVTAGGVGSNDPTGKPMLLPVSAVDYVSGYLMALGAIVALARRAREGGSWLVRVSLARTGKWIVDRGFFEGFRELPEDLPREELQALVEERDSPYGRIRHLRPVLHLSETKPFWARPPVPLGSSPAQWLQAILHGLSARCVKPIGCL